MNYASEQLYYNLLLFTLGSSFLALAYHLILYFQRRENLLFHYCVYLFFLTGFLISRVVFHSEQSPGMMGTAIFHFWDELLQMLLYYTYIEFTGRAIGIERRGHPVLFRAWKVLGYIVLAIAFVQAFIILFNISDKRNLLLALVSRLLLIVISLLILSSYSFKKKTVFQSYILTGAILFLIFGALSFLSDIYKFEILGLYAVSFTFLGEIADVLLFSAAMGYRIRQTYEEKEMVMKELEVQQELVRQKDMEKMKAVIKTRYNERNRIARELHDDVGSSLSSINIFSIIAEQPAKSAEMIGKIKDTSARIMENMSDLVWAINAETDDTASLISRIRQFGSFLLEVKEIEFEVSAGKNVLQLYLKAEAKKNILLICKEAINNSAKYSNATRVRIDFGLTDDLFFFTITDNGKSFVAGDKQGNGLVNMQKRCEDSGGRFELKTGNGTTINCSFPVTNISN